MTIETLAAITVAFLVAGTVKGMVGMGLPTISVAIMGGVLGLREAIPILMLPSLIANIWQSARPNPIGPLLRRFALINVASCVGIWIGTIVLFRVDPRLLSAVLGIVIVVYALISALAVELDATRRQERTLAVPVGLFSGILTGSTGSLLLPSFCKRCT